MSQRQGAKFPGQQPSPVQPPYPRGDTPPSDWNRNSPWSSGIREASQYGRQNRGPNQPPYPVDDDDSPYGGSRARTRSHSRGPPASDSPPAYEEPPAYDILDKRKTRREYGRHSSVPRHGGIEDARERHMSYGDNKYSNEQVPQSSGSRAKKYQETKSITTGELVGTLAAAGAVGLLSTQVSPDSVKRFFRSRSSAGRQEESKYGTSERSKSCNRRD